MRKFAYTLLWLMFSMAMPWLALAVEHPPAATRTLELDGERTPLVRPRVVRTVPVGRDGQLVKQKQPVKQEQPAPPVWSKEGLIVLAVVGIVLFFMFNRTRIEEAASTTAPKRKYDLAAAKAALARLQKQHHQQFGHLPDAALESAPGYRDLQFAMLYAFADIRRAEIELGIQPAESFLRPFTSEGKTASRSSSGIRDDGGNTDHWTGPASDYASDRGGSNFGTSSDNTPGNHGTSSDSSDDGNWSDR